MKKTNNLVCLTEIIVNILIRASIVFRSWLNKKTSTEVEPVMDYSTDEDNNTATEKWHKRYDKCLKKNRRANKHNIHCYEQED